MTIESKIHPLQKFRVETIPRSRITAASYNPRTILDDNRKSLKKNLETKGLLDTLVFNETTGNLVSGHQRLAQLDSYHQKKFGNVDYELTVAVVNLSLKEEIEQNIFFNNANAQGQFDDTLLMEIVRATNLPQIDFTDAGFTTDDVQFFGITTDLETINTEDVAKTISDFEAVKEQRKSEITPEIAASRKDAVKAAKTESRTNEVDTIVTLTFSNQRDKRSFMQLIGEDPQGLFLKGEIFVDKYFAQ